MSAGTYIFSSLCSTTGIPLPLFHTEIVFDSLRDETKVTDQSPAVPVMVPECNLRIQGDLDGVHVLVSLFVVSGVDCSRGIGDKERRTSR